MKKRFLALIFILSLILSCFSVPSAAQPDTKRPDTSRAISVLLYHLDSDSIIYAQKADELVYPAATVKIMVALAVIDHYSQSPEGLDTKITVPINIQYETLGITGIRMGLRGGEILSAYDLLCGVVVRGANDAAYTLATAIDGSIDTFLSRMNKKAKELGMKDTVYHNVSGLDVAPSVTANDLLILCRYIFENKTYMEIAGMKEYKIKATETNDTHTLYTRNYLLSKQTYSEYYYAPANGMSAGSTEKAGGCIAASARINNQNYLCIIMGADQLEGFTLAKDLFEWVSSCYQYKTIISRQNVLGEIPVALADSTDHISIVAGAEITRFLPVSAEESNIEIKTKLYFKQLSAPVKAGRIVGEAYVYLDGECIGSVPLITANALAKDHSASLQRRIIRFITSTEFLFISATIILVGIIYVLIIARIRYQRMVKQIMELPDEEEENKRNAHPRAKLPPKR